MLRPALLHRFQHLQGTSACTRAFSQAASVSPCSFEPIALKSVSDSVPCTFTEARPVDLYSSDPFSEVKQLCDSWLIQQFSESAPVPEPDITVVTATESEFLRQSSLAAAATVDKPILMVVATDNNSTSEDVQRTPDAHTPATLSPTSASAAMTGTAEQELKSDDGAAAAAATSPKSIEHQTSTDFASGSASEDQREGASGDEDVDGDAVEGFTTIRRRRRERKRARPKKPTPSEIVAKLQSQGVIGHKSCITHVVRVSENGTVVRFVSSDAWIKLTGLIITDDKKAQRAAGDVVHVIIQKVWQDEQSLWRVECIDADGAASSSVPAPAPKTAVASEITAVSAPVATAAANGPGAEEGDTILVGGVSCAVDAAQWVPCSTLPPAPAPVSAPASTPTAATTSAVPATASAAAEAAAPELPRKKSLNPQAAEWVPKPSPRPVMMPYMMMAPPMQMMGSPRFMPMARPMFYIPQQHPLQSQMLQQQQQ